MYGCIFVEMCTKYKYTLGHFYMIKSSFCEKFKLCQIFKGKSDIIQIIQNKIGIFEPLIVGILPITRRIRNNFEKHTLHTHFENTY